MTCLPVDDAPVAWLTAQAVGGAPVRNTDEGLGHDLMSFLSDFRGARHPARASSSPSETVDLVDTAETTAQEEEGACYGSEDPQGPGWWIATDGRWYPPELHPQAQADAGV